MTRPPPVRTRIAYALLVLAPGLFASNTSMGAVTRRTRLRIEGHEWRR
jgi:hypothetical protein